MQVAIIRAGGLPPLLHLLRNGSKEAQEHATRALLRLCEETSNQQASHRIPPHTPAASSSLFLSSPLSVPATSHLPPPTSHLPPFSPRSLLPLALCAQAVVDCGLIGELVTLCKGGTAVAQELAAQVLSDLARGAAVEREQREAAARAERQARRRAGREAANRRREQASAGGSAPRREEEEEAAAAESEYGSEASARDDVSKEGEGEGARSSDRISAIAAAGGIIPLVGMLTSGSPLCKEYSASALAHLSIDCKVQAAITRSNGIAPVVALLDNGTAAAHGFAAAALARLANGSPDNQIQIAKRLVTLLAPPASEGAQQRAAQQLREIAVSNQGAAARVVNAGAIAPLITLLGSGPLHAKDSAVGVLSCLAQSDASYRLAVATGLVTLQRLAPEQAKEQVNAVLAELGQAQQAGGAAGGGGEQAASAIAEVISLAAKKARAVPGAGGVGARKSGVARRKAGGVVTSAADREALRSFLEATGGTAAVSSSATALRGLLGGTLDGNSSGAKTGVAGSAASAASLVPAGNALRSLLDGSSATSTGASGGGIGGGAAAAVGQNGLLRTDCSSEALRSMLLGGAGGGGATAAGLVGAGRNGLDLANGAGAGAGRSGLRSLGNWLDVTQPPAKSKRPALSLSLGKAKQGAPQPSNRVPQGVSQGSSRPNAQASTRLASNRASKSKGSSQRASQSSQREAGVASRRASRDAGKSKQPAAKKLSSVTE